MAENHDVTDVVIIGGGVVGAAIAHALSKYKVRTTLVEKNMEIGWSTTKANSGIVHAGFHDPLDTNKGRLCLKGNRMFEELCAKLDVPFKRNGILMVALDSNDIPVLEQYRRQGIQNGLQDLRILTKDELLTREPNLNPDIFCGLYAPNGGIVSPFELAIALCEVAEQNGVQIRTGTEVQAMVESGDGIQVKTSKGTIQARYVVNAAGLWADAAAQMLGDHSISIRPRKGEEYIFDKRVGDLVTSTIFPTPKANSKGILVIPTVGGNIMIGPNAVEEQGKDDVDTTLTGWEEIYEFAKRLVPRLQARDVITSFSGIRAASATGDFVIGPSQACPRLVHAAGTESPGLTASLAIALDVLACLQELGLRMEPNPQAIDQRVPMQRFHQLTREEQARLIEKDPRFGRVVCRCETITEGEIVDAIRRGARTVDGVKFRTRAGMGRCQGGFCQPVIMGILARELRISEVDINKHAPESKILVGKVNKGFGKTHCREHSVSLRKKTGSVEYDVVVIGGGPGGMAAALAAKGAGAGKVAILERAGELGGILNQCIHNGFGLHWFKEELTGPEYATRFVQQVQRSGIDTYLNTMVLELTSQRRITAVSSDYGLVEFTARSVVFAAGCRERTRGAINIPGYRPAGVLTAGTAQRYINIEGFMPGREVVILGSGDIGLIMARRLTLEGAKVKAVIEILPYAAGLARNVAQCLEDFHIPLYLGSTVINIHGQERINGVTMAQVDPDRAVVPGTERFIPCDTLLLSVGLIPENELTAAGGVKLDPRTGGPTVDEYRHTSIPGVYACGNVLHVHDLVDYVSEEGEIAGTAAALGYGSHEGTEIVPGRGVRYVVPHRLSAAQPFNLYLRVLEPQERARLFIGDKQVVKRNVKPSEMLRIGISAQEAAELRRLKRVEVRLEEAP
ncbi:MAG: FAD-dependent oxidoreductase [Limnochordia bacterium]|jgi:glycerol-3-phosphate dehydrogenase